MTPRLRKLHVGDGQVLLILDRVQVLSVETAQELSATKPDGVAGVMVFPFEVYIPDTDDPDPEPTGQGVTLHPDEADAIDRLWAVAQGYTGAKLRVTDEQTLTLLLARAREARP